ncbi:hypothetical protein ACOSQ2_027564 [Xanthoceras sorbifolium]
MFISGLMYENPSNDSCAGITIWWLVTCWKSSTSQASQVVRSSVVNPLFDCGNCLKANVGAGRGEVMLKMDNTAMVNPSVSSLFIFGSPDL